VFLTDNFLLQDILQPPFFFFSLRNEGTESLYPFVDFFRKVFLIFVDKQFSNVLYFLSCNFCINTYSNKYGVAFGDFYEISQAVAITLI
jgi:hypothetical protein